MELDVSDQCMWMANSAHSIHSRIGESDGKNFDRQSKRNNKFKYMYLCIFCIVHWLVTISNRTLANESERGGGVGRGQRGAWLTRARKYMMTSAEIKYNETTNLDSNFLKCMRLLSIKLLGSRLHWVRLETACPPNSNSQRHYSDEATCMEWNDDQTDWYTIFSNQVFFYLPLYIRINKMPWHHRSHVQIVHCFQENEQKIEKLGPFHLSGHRYKCSEAGENVTAIFVANGEENVERLIQWHLRCWKFGTQFIRVGRVRTQRALCVVQQVVACIAVEIEWPHNETSIDAQMSVGLKTSHFSWWRESHAWQYIAAALHLTKLLRTFATVEW